MKKNLLYLFVVVSIFLFSSCSQNSATISGSVEGDDSSIVAIGDLLIDDNLDTIQVVDGHFNQKMEISEPGYYIFAFGNEMKQLFLAPGYELNIKIIKTETETQFVFEGKGEAENNMLQKIMASLDQIDYPYLEKIEPSLINSYINTLFNGFRDSFEKMIKGKKLDPNFVNFQNRYIDFKEATLKTILGLQHNIKEESYYSFIDTLEINNPQYLGIPDFRWFIEYYTEKLLDEKLSTVSELQRSKPEVWIKAKFAIIETFENDKIKEYLTFSTIKQILEYEGIEGFDLCRESYNKNLTHDNYRDQIKLILDKKMTLAKGKPAPEFLVYNQNDQEVRLSDFKGKLVYIDFWATWCRPCREESPFYRTLSKEFQGKNVVFVSISLDDPQNLETWKTMIKEDPYIVHLRTHDGWSPAISQAYQVSGVPTYVLIDQEGKIIDASAPRPSSGEIKPLLDSNLK